MFLIDLTPMIDLSPIEMYAGLARPEQERTIPCDKICGMLSICTNLKAYLKVLSIQGSYNDSAKNNQIIMNMANITHSP